MEKSARRRSWEERGFFVYRNLVSAADARTIEEEVIRCIRANPPEAHPGEALYEAAGSEYAIVPEKRPSPVARQPEDRVAKVFNCHTEGHARELAESGCIVDVVAEILGADLDCFHSQFIFKSPGVIGQPWHQDSYYFRFDTQPQVGVWLAVSRATFENGCLWVLPGSHQGPIHNHVPDRRPAANRAYMEIMDQDDTERVAVLMQPGDALFFHSYLMHMSTENFANERRAAIVYHYARAGTRAQTPEIEAALSHVNRWIPVRRREAA